MNDTDLAWVAGIIDGEGSLDIKGKYCQPVVTVGMKSRITIRKIYDVLKIGNIGGTKYAIWNLTGSNNIIKVLELILPYLVTKREQATLLIQYCRTLPCHRGGNNKLSAEQLADRKRHFDAIKVLNSLYL